MSNDTPPQIARPNTACLGCRRRKLKCSRETEGCVHCTKSDLPCVYPTALETGVKRKRGPYKKDKRPRDRHIEELMKYLEPRTSGSESRVASALAPGEGPASLVVPDRGGNVVQSGLGDFASASTMERHSSRRSETLVKDALIALTRSCGLEREVATECEESTWSSPQPVHPPTQVVSRVSHPPARQLCEYWQLFFTRVDPLTKVVHCPTLGRKLFAAIDRPSALGNGTETLFFSIYYAAVTACTADEAQRRFGESRELLLQRHSGVIEAALADQPGDRTLERFQALVLYLICVRRQDNDTNVPALFNLAVRIARSMGLDEDPDDTYAPLEAELRRRLWWHICGLESRGAEEGGVRTTSIMHGHNVRFPANLNDDDLDSRSVDTPQPRTGVADTTFVLLRWEIVRLIYRIRTSRRQDGEGRTQLSPEALQSQQNELYEETKTRLDREYTQHLHSSRAPDWMCLRLLESLLAKTNILINYPVFSRTPNPTQTLRPQARYHLLQLSVDIISCTRLLATDARIEDWCWFFRSYSQWHALAIVVAELGHSTNTWFARSAWEVVDPILVGWERTYASRRGQPAWVHVNTLIERAKRMRDLQDCRHGATQPRLFREGAGESYRQSLAEGDVAPAAVCSSSSVVAETHTVAEVPTPHQDTTLYSYHNNNDIRSEPFTSQPAVLSMPKSQTDLGISNGLGQIDFGAFDAVFGSASWEFPGVAAELNFELT